MSEQAEAQDAPNPSGKIHRMLSGEAEYAAAIDDVILKAGRVLHIFDIDFSGGGYSSLARFENLRQFLSRDRNNRLVIVLHETAQLPRHCPRLMNLLRLYSHAISILETSEHARIANDPFVVADALHSLHRFHADSARARLALEDPAEARQLEERFDQLVEASTPALSATTLGL
jgi:hypothetical protein